MITVAGWGAAEYGYVLDFDLSIGSWVSVTVAGVQPVDRSRPALIYDPVRDRIVMFGGEINLNTDFDDTWELTSVHTYAPPHLSLCSAPFFNNNTSFYPPSGDANTNFEFRIEYQDSSSLWPLGGYPRMVLDWDGNGSIDHQNDGYFPMSQSIADEQFIDGVDYSVFMPIPAGGNPKIKFEAYNSENGYAVYPASGWLDGPTIIDAGSTDLFMYANDINFSGYPDLPAVGEEVVIYARIRNNSPNAFNPVRIDFHIDGVLADSFFVQLPSRDIYGNPGFVDISVDTVFNQADFLDIEFVVDPQNAIGEWNEHNNTAIRALLIGDYLLAGNIHINDFTLGDYYPMSWVSGGGSAWYEQNGDSLRHLSGTPVYIKLLEGDIPLDTVYVNDNGFFNYSFRAPLGVGQYHAHITITDFTITDTAFVPFEVVPPPGPDLVINYNLGGLPLNVCGSNNLYINNPVVQNLGAQMSDSCRAAILHDSDTLLSVNVPPLNPGQFYMLSTVPLIVYNTTQGYYDVRGVADYANEVAEIAEGNNINIKNYTVWCCPEDLNTEDIRLNRVAYKECPPVNISALVSNLGGLPALDFDLRFIDSYVGGIDTIAMMEDLSLSAGGDSVWFTAYDYSFPDTGWHQIIVTADPHYAVVECREDNNQFDKWVYVYPQKSELYTSYDLIRVDNPEAIEGQTVTFSAQVGNSACVGAGGFNVRFALDGQPYSGNPDVFIPGIGSETTMTIVHPQSWTVDWSKCPLDVYIDYGDAIDEYNEGNNGAIVPMPYDFYPHYGGRCPLHNPPTFFDACWAYTTDTVGININIRNAGLFNFNGSLQINLYDSLAGSPAPVLMESRYISGPYLNHRLNMVHDIYSHSFSEPGTHYVTLEINAGPIVPECDYGNNRVTYGIDIIEPQSDLVIQSEWILLSQLNPDLGDTLYIDNVDVYNNGDSTAYNVLVSFQLNGIALGEVVTIDSIPFYGPSNYRSIQPTEFVIVDTCEPSTNIIEVCADPLNAIVEWNEANNCATKSVIYCEAADLYVKELYLDPDCGEIGDSVNIVAVVADSGNANSSAIIDFFYLGDAAIGWWDTTYIASAVLDTILGGSDTTLASIRWQRMSDSTFIFTRVSYVYPHDYNPGNNHHSSLFFCQPLCPYIPGDINSSGAANGIDVTYGVTYLKGGNAPPDSCDCPPMTFPFYGAMDVNGTCSTNGIDITYFVSYLKGGQPALLYCEDCPPASRGPVIARQIEGEPSHDKIISEPIKQEKPVAPIQRPVIKQRGKIEASD
ncbi:MAG: hypothetical protein A2W25_13295 [candidate division Zixibacteria bacterium RBG_16_53_22]|nr:MAG: hypothetical protein A2W25_13295 [candidate division Zixibacteria bacterium RBG_16_53_22]